MAVIKVMDEILSNKIAAGEVVERCASVVKELVENSIDAGATEIKVELRDAGTKEIKVIDNGKGMDEDDAVLSFSRHATSKLKTLDDLFHIDSLGFRGEALPSIASVSKMCLKTSDGSVGTIIDIEGGKLVSVEDADIRCGTSITVKELFYNTPVRLKYLKNLYTELANITDYVNKMALSYPNIRFILTNNGKMLLNTDGSNRLLKVINDIYGLDVTKRMVEINGENDDYVIHGYISYPELMKSTKTSITILVNGRVIKNNDIVRMITDSYHTYMPRDKYPIAVLMIDVDPILIDVNIHPTKMDIKFSKANTLKELVTSVISETLSKLTLIPDAGRTTKIENGVTSITNSYQKLYENNNFDSSIKRKEYEEFEKYDKLNFNLEVSLDEESDNYEVRDDDFSYMNEDDSNSDDSNLDDDLRIKEMYPVGLVHGTYIIAENEDGMFLIDQHAANERINYEYYLRQMSNPKPNVIDLLIPINIELPSNEYLVLKNNLHILTDLGFVIEEFGFNTFLIRTVPLWLPKGNEENAIKHIFEIVTVQESFDLSKFVDKVAATVACKASIKANDFITLDDMRVLLTRLRKCKNPFTCPHGRPTIITYSKYDLEKMFKRSM